MRWWQFGLCGGTALLLATVVKVIRAAFRGTLGEAGEDEWGETAAFASFLFGIGFLCGVIVWAGRGLHEKIGMVGDAIVGVVVMVTFFASCILLADPELFRSKFSYGGLPMLGMAVFLGLVCGPWIGRDLRKEAARQEELKRPPEPRRWSDDNPFDS
jgi:hypothetical protein